MLHHHVPLRHEKRLSPRAALSGSPPGALNEKQEAATAQRKAIPGEINSLPKLPVYPFNVSFG
jgi:hypothetical protein